MILIHKHDFQLFHLLSRQQLKDCTFLCPFHLGHHRVASCHCYMLTSVRDTCPHSQRPEMQRRGYLTNRFHVAVRLFSNRSQMTSKCGKNKKVAHEAQPSVSLMFLPHFDVLCDLLLNRRTATWNLFVLYNKKIKIHGKNALLFQISPL